MESKSQTSKLEEEVKSLKALVSQLLNIGYPHSNTSVTPSHPTTPLNNAHNNSISLQNLSNSFLLSALDKQRNLPMRYGNDTENEMFKPLQQHFNDMLKLDTAAVDGRNGVTQKDLNYMNAMSDNGDCTLVQMEKSNFELRRELQDALANNKQAGKMIQTYAIHHHLRINWILTDFHVFFLLLFFSLEYKLQHLQKTQANSGDNNNVITISTGRPSPPPPPTTSSSSSIQTNNNLPHHEDFNNPTKIQFTDQSAKVTSNGRRTSTVNLVGPVTDL